LDISPSARIQEVRLQQAKLLLEQDKININEVAFAVGFDSLSNFYNSFKKYYGLTPLSNASTQKNIMTISESYSELDHIKRWRS
jgi:AraC-like DNA-binding protein